MWSFSEKQYAHLKSLLGPDFLHPQVPVKCARLPVAWAHKAILKTPKKPRVWHRQQQEKKEKNRI